MNGTNAASSDLSLAKRLSWELAADTSPAPPEATPYVPFPAVAHRHHDAPLPPPLPPPVLAEDGSIGAVAWSKLLPWAVSSTATSAAIVISHSGLIIAAHGQLPAGEHDGLAALLSMAMEQIRNLRLFHAEPGSLAVEIGEQWATVSDIPLAEPGEWLALVLLGPTIPPRATRQAILREMTAVLSPSHTS